MWAEKEKASAERGERVQADFGKEKEGNKALH